MKKNYVTLLVIFFTSVSLWAQDDSKLNVDLQLRSRGEFRDGALMPSTGNDDPAAFINNRTRLNLGYIQDYLEIGLSVQHVGVWGDDKQIHKDADLGVHEAWAKMTFGKGFFVKLGRQEISYDDQRILGALDWHVAGRHHDALKVGYENEKNKLHLILAFNQNGEKVHGNFYDANSGQPYKSMQTLWYNVAASSSSNLSFLFMNLGIQAKDNVEYMQTVGSYMDFKLTPKLNAKVSGYYQFGSTVNKQDIAAYMLSGVLDYKFSDRLKGKLGVDYLSGDEETSGRAKAFNPLYGTHHKFYGAMDYFYASPFMNNLTPGLWDTYLGFTYKVNPKLNLGLDYHYFQTAIKIHEFMLKRTIYIDYGRYLASEFDLNAKWNIHKDITLTGGFSFALPYEIMEYVKGGNADTFQSWTWISLNVSPRIFTR